MEEGLTQPAKLLLLAALLAKDKVISQNSKAYLKELALRRDEKLIYLLREFESRQTDDAAFLEKIHDAIEAESEVLYKDLFFDTPTDVGKQLSRDERFARSLDEEKSLIYGEVEYHSFYSVLRKINPSLLSRHLQDRRPQGLTFYDLGAGTGKAVMMARMLYDFRDCVGVELLTSLFQQSKVIEERFNNKFRFNLTAGRAQHIEFHEGSLLDLDWSDGDVVFANSTCFDDSLMDDMSRQADALAPGSIFVTFTKGLSNKHLVRGGRRLTPTFELLDKKRHRMSWGPATVFIHRRLNADGSSVEDGYKLSYLPCDATSYDDDTSLASLSPDGSASEEESDAGSDDSSRSYEDQDIITHHRERTLQDLGNMDDDEADTGVTDAQFRDMQEYYRQLREAEEGDSDSDSDYQPGESSSSDSDSDYTEESDSGSSESPSSESDSDSATGEDNYDDDDDEALYETMRRAQQQDVAQSSPRKSSPSKTSSPAKENSPALPSALKKNSSPSRGFAPSFVSPSKDIPDPSSYLPSAISTSGHHGMHHVRFSSDTHSSPSTASNSSPFMNSPMDAALLKRKQVRQGHAVE